MPLVGTSVLQMQQINTRSNCHESPSFTTSPTIETTEYSPTDSAFSPTSFPITLCKSCCLRQSRGSQRQSFENLTIISRAASYLSLHPLIQNATDDHEELDVVVSKRPNSVVSLASAILHEDIDRDVCRSCAKKQLRGDVKRKFEEITSSNTCGENSFPEGSGRERKSRDYESGEMVEENLEDSIQSPESEKAEKPMTRC
ncbi:hypothetical protein BGZ60DRAFT_528109 [Tricladium varicosporioides]|nr:hypothetical protein BGZ60DRAFT_528109 [Hymenoscyphus varicosporioides]